MREYRGSLELDVPDRLRAKIEWGDRRAGQALTAAQYSKAS
jgi:hypothetical protein